MPKPAPDIPDTITHRNRFLRFTPTISAGHIMTAVCVLFTATEAWTHIEDGMDTLAKENAARKGEIIATVARQDADRVDLYKKIAEDHAATQEQIKESQQNTHEELKEIAAALGTRFDRVDDKLDKKADKK